MSGSAMNDPLPPAARMFISSVPALMGYHSKKTTQDVLKEIRKQRTEPPTIAQLVDSDTYWTLVGMMKDKFTEPKPFHIDLIKTFIKESHPDSWFEKLYTSICTSIGNEDKIKTLEATLGRKKDVILCGKPDIIEGKTVIMTRKVAKFDEEGLRNEHKVLLHSYMKVCKLKKSILREVCGTETRDTAVQWNSSYWKKIEKLILAFIECIHDE
jgi:hypothetical protein